MLFSQAVPVIASCCHHWLLLRRSPKGKIGAEPCDSDLYRLWPLIDRELAFASGEPTLPDVAVTFDLNAIENRLVVFLSKVANCEVSLT